MMFFYIVTSICTVCAIAMTAALFSDAKYNRTQERRDIEVTLLKYRTLGVIGFDVIVVVLYMMLFSLIK